MVAKTKIASRSRGRLRGKTIRSEKFLQSLRDAKQVLLLTHNNPDPDGLAGMKGLELLLKKKLNLSPVLAYGGIVGRAETRALIELLGMELVPVSKIDFGQFDAVVLSDTQPETGNNSLPPDVVPRAVIDHHRSGGNLKGVCYRDVRRSAASLCSIVTEYLSEQGIKPSAKLAAGLFYGIKTDLVSRESAFNLADNQHLLELYALADKKLLAQIESARLPRAHFESFLLALKNTFVYDDVVVCNLDEMPSPDLAAEIADFLLRFEQINWVMVSGLYGNEVILALRTSLSDADASKLLPSLLPRGTAGGHSTKAGGQIPLENPNLTNVQQLQNDIKKNLLRRLEKYKERGMRLVPKKRIVGKI